MEKNLRQTTYQSDLAYKWCSIFVGLHYVVFDIWKFAEQGLNCPAHCRILSGELFPRRRIQLLLILSEKGAQTYLWYPSCSWK